MITFLTAKEVLLKMNEFIDNKPTYCQNNHTKSYEIFLATKNNIGYRNKIELLVESRFIRFRYRDEHQLIEYQLSMMPWSGSFSLMAWNDNKGCSTIDQSKYPNCGCYYSITEEEFFQASTVKDFNGMTLQLIRDVEKLQNKIYEYFDVEPCEQEKFYNEI